MSRCASELLISCGLRRGGENFFPAFHLPLILVAGNAFFNLSVVQKQVSLSV